MVREIFTNMVLTVFRFLNSFTGATSYYLYICLGETHASKIIPSKEVLMRIFYPNKLWIFVEICGVLVADAPHDFILDLRNLQNFKGWRVGK